MDIKSQLKVNAIYSACPNNVSNGLKAADATDYWELIYVVRGSISITLDKNIFECKEGIAILCKPSQIHSVWFSHDDAQYITISFSIEDEPSVIDENLIYILSEYEKNLVSGLGNIISQSDFFIDGFPNSLLNSQDTVSIFVKTLELLFLHLLQKNTVSPETVNKETEVFTKAVTIMQKNIASQVSVDDLAEKLSISLSYLKRAFSKFTLIGVHEYYTYLKVEFAKQLLKQGNSVTETAKLAGFSNQNYFSLAFKRVTGTSPKNYLSAKDKVYKPALYKTKSQPSRELPAHLL